MYNATLREGDIVIIHTGWGDLFEQFPAQNATYNSGEPGIGKDAATWLISQKIVAVGNDTWGVEVIPGEDPKEAFIVHNMLLTDNGIHIIENVRTDLMAASRQRIRPLDVLLQHDGAEGRRADRQLRRDRGHPLDRVLPCRKSRQRRRRSIRFTGGSAGASGSSPAGSPRCSPPAARPAGAQGSGAGSRASRTSRRSLASRWRARASPGPRSGESFVLAARQYPVDVVFYDNQRDNARALANAEDAIARGVSLYILYHRDAATNAAIAGKLKAAGIPCWPSATRRRARRSTRADNLAAGRIAGSALGEFGAGRGEASRGWLLFIGSSSGGAHPRAPQGVAAGLAQHLPGRRVTISLDTQGNPAQVAPLLGKLLAAHPTSKAPDRRRRRRARALAAKSALESANRLRDASHREPWPGPLDPRRHERSEGDRSRTTGAASSSGRWRSTWTATATTCCRWRSACCAARRCRRARRPAPPDHARRTCSSSTRPTT